jgi:hypothetical protein
MLFNTKKIVDICSKKKLTPNHLFYCYAIYRNDWELLYKAHYEMVVKINDNHKIKLFNTVEILQPLLDMGYLKPISIEEFKAMTGYDPFKWDKLQVTDKFVKELLIDYSEAGEELWEIYPNFITVNGNKVSTKKGGDYKGKYLSKEQLIELYLDKINYSVEQHKENLEGIKKAIKAEHSLPVIRSYIIDEMWESYNSLEEKATKQDRFTAI